MWLEWSPDGVRTCRGREKAGSVVARHGVVGRVRGDGSDDVRRARCRVVDRAAVRGRPRRRRSPARRERTLQPRRLADDRVPHERQAMCSAAEHISTPSSMIATLRQVADAYRDRAEEIEARAVAVRSVRLQPALHVQPTVTTCVHRRSIPSIIFERCSSRASTR